MVRSMNRWGVWCVLAAVFTGCQTLEDKGAAYYQIREGSTLVLNQELQIPADAARVSIQNGEVRPYGLVNEFSPYCEFEVVQVKPTAQSVTPDEFVIHRVVHRTFSVSLSPGTTASLGLTIGLSGGDGPRQTFYATVLYLHSDRQPDVLKLTCESDRRVFPGIAYARHLTVSEIQEALGAILTLRINRQSSAGSPTRGSSTLSADRTSESRDLRSVPPKYLPKVDAHRLVNCRCPSHGTTT